MNHGLFAVADLRWAVAERNWILAKFSKVLVQGAIPFTEERDVFSTADLDNANDTTSHYIAVVTWTSLSSHNAPTVYFKDGENRLSPFAIRFTTIMAFPFSRSSNIASNISLAAFPLSYRARPWNITKFFFPNADRKQISNWA